MTRGDGQRIGMIRVWLLAIVALGMMLDAGGTLKASGNGTPLRISGVAHDAERPLGSGTSLRVSVRGTTGARATFTVAGATSHVSMQEIQPGLYQGVYAVRLADNVTNAVVVGWLRRDRELAFATAAPLTIDTVPPRLLRRSPSPGEVVRTLKPTIVIAVSDPGGTGVDVRSSRLIVNGQDVTAHTVWAQTGFGYSPPMSLNGQVTVEVFIADLAGNVTRDRYMFYVGTGPEGR